MNIRRDRTLHVKKLNSNFSIIQTMDRRFVFCGLSQKYTLLMISLTYYNVEQLFFILASRFNSFFQAQKLFYRFRDFKEHTAKQLQ